MSSSLPRPSAPLLRRCAALVSAWLVLLCLAPVAHADDTITSQWYTVPAGIDDLHRQGLDGSGVTIAMIDGGVDTGVPELAGADITTVNPCRLPPDPATVWHGTSVASVLVSPHFGWAPKARLLSLYQPTGAAALQSCAEFGGNTLGYLINQALEQGADVITVQATIDAGSYAGTPDVAYALARASLAGVPVVISVGNEGSANITTASLNTVVGVGASQPEGEPASFNNTGVGLDILAPGTGIALRQPDSGGALTRVGRADGTSAAAPMVAGALALARQRWPDADGNQLLHTLLATADRNEDRWRPTHGWGGLDARAFLASDPSGQPRDNPLIAKRTGALPSREQLADYRDGLADPGRMPGNTSYIYRGDDEAICTLVPERCELGTSPRFTASAPPAGDSSAPAASPAPSPGGGVPPLVVVLAGVGLIGAVAGVIVIVARRWSTGAGP